MIEDIRYSIEDVEGVDGTSWIKFKGTTEDIAKILKYLKHFYDRPVYDVPCDDSEVTEYDNVNHPEHYTKSGVECIDEMLLLYGAEETMSFCKLNSHKYRKRALHKGGEEDINKSDWYIAKYKELKETNEQDKRSAYASQLDIIKSMIKDGVKFDFNISNESLFDAINNKTADEIDKQYNK